MNQAAERQVESGNVLRIENNRLAPIDRGRALRLPEPSTMRLQRRPQRQTLGCRLLSLERGRGSGRHHPPALSWRTPQSLWCLCRHGSDLRARPGGGAAFPGEAFAKLYGLTGSELRVLLAMAPGLSVKEAAEVLGIGETTAKTHLQHIYAKTGTSKQTELMHLFMSSTPPVKAA